MKIYIKYHFILFFILITPITLFSPPAQAGKQQASQPDDNNIYEISDDGRVVKFDHLPWDEIQPVLDELINEKIKDSSIEEAYFLIDVTRDDWKSYTNWLFDSMSNFKYPQGISARNKGVEGDAVDGIYALYHVEVNLSNFALKEEDARKEFVYKIFEGKINPGEANIETFYNLIARAEDQLKIRDEFINANILKSEKNFQDKIYVKAVTLESESLDEAELEAEKIVSKLLPKLTQPYVALIFSIPKDAQYKIGDFSVFRYTGAPQLYEDREQRLYIFFPNDKRTTLDLHGMRFKEAKKRAKAFILEKYNNNETSLTLLTGVGSHSEGGVSVIRNAVPSWLASDEIKPLIEDYELLKEKHGYSIKLKKAAEINLNNLTPNQNPLILVRDALINVMKNGLDRLSVKTKDDKFYGQLTLFLMQHNDTAYGKILPVSYEFLPGEIIINLEDYDETSEESDSGTPLDNTQSSQTNSTKQSATTSKAASTMASEKQKAKGAQSAKAKAKNAAVKPAKEAKKTKSSAPKPKAMPAPAKAKPASVKAMNQSENEAEQKILRDIAAQVKANEAAQAKAKDKARAAQSARDKAKAAALKAMQAKPSPTSTPKPKAAPAPVKAKPAPAKTKAQLDKEKANAKARATQPARDEANNAAIKATKAKTAPAPVKAKSAPIKAMTQTEKEAEQKILRDIAAQVKANKAAQAKARAAQSARDKAKAAKIKAKSQQEKAKTQKKAS